MPKEQPQSSHSRAWRSSPYGPYNSAGSVRGRGTPTGNGFATFPTVGLGQYEQHRDRRPPSPGPRGPRREPATGSSTPRSGLWSDDRDHRDHGREAKLGGNAGSQAKTSLTMVDSMALQTVKTIGDKRVPGLSVHSDSNGGGAQMNIFTKVPEAQSTLMFKIESEEALIEAYRRVRAMNPSAPVGGIMFSVASKTSPHAVDVATVD
ncbi:hypothetical protein ACJ41O_013267 [Fusarium nematophilum]